MAREAGWSRRATPHSDRGSRPRAARGDAPHRPVGGQLRAVGRRDRRSHPRAPRRRASILGERHEGDTVVRSSRASTRQGSRSGSTAAGAWTRCWKWRPASHSDLDVIVSVVTSARAPEDAPPEGLSESPAARRGTSCSRIRARPRGRRARDPSSTRAAAAALCCPTGGSGHFRRPPSRAGVESVTRGALSLGRRPRCSATARVTRRPRRISADMERAPGALRRRAAARAVPAGAASRGARAGLRRARRARADLPPPRRH